MAGAAVGFVGSNRQKSFQKQQETARSRVRQARHDQKDRQKDKKESRSKNKNPKKGWHSSTGLRRGCGEAATGVIFAVDVVPLSILAS